MAWLVERAETRKVLAGKLLTRGLRQAMRFVFPKQPDCIAGIVTATSREALHLPWITPLARARHADRIGRHPPTFGAFALDANWPGHVSRPAGEVESADSGFGLRQYGQPSPISPRTWRAICRALMSVAFVLGRRCFGFGKGVRGRL